MNIYIIPFSSPLYVSVCLFLIKNKKNKLMLLIKYLNFEFLLSKIIDEK